MPWQKKIFNCYQTCAGMPVSIAFFHSFEKFLEKLHKHVLSSKESKGWEMVFPEIVKKHGEKYNKRGQISKDQAVCIYEEMALVMEKSLYFLWKFPLHIHIQRKEGDAAWISRTVGISPYGFSLVCDDEALISFYFRGSVSKHSGKFQRFYTARFLEFQKARRLRFRDEEKKIEIEQRDQKVCNETTWTKVFLNKNEFESFYRAYQAKEGGPLTQELDDLLAGYSRNGL